MDIVKGPAPGPDVVAAGVDEVLAAIDSLSPDLDWASVSDDVIPVFQRVRPYPPGVPEPMRIVVPPGLSVGFAIDIGPALLNIQQDLAARWNMSAASLLGRALENLDRRMADVSPTELFEGSIDGERVRLLQPRAGSASTYVLLPSSLHRILGTQPQLVLAPMRNLLVSMAATTDRDFASWLFNEFAAQDPNSLAPLAFMLQGNAVTVEPLGVAFATA